MPLRGKNILSCHSCQFVYFNLSALDRKTKFCKILTEKLLNTSDNDYAPFQQLDSAQFNQTVPPINSTFFHPQYGTGLKPMFNKGRV